MTLDDIRRMYPDTAGHTDYEILQRLAERQNLPVETMANVLGYQEDKNALSDTAVDLTRGVVGLGQAATGIANLATGGEAGRKIRETFGGDLQDVQDKLGRMYSSRRQQAEQNVAGAHGFMDTASALVHNPSVLVGGAIQSAPSMALPIGIGGRVAGMAVKAAERATPALERAALEKIGETAANRGQTAGWTAITAGQTADRINHEAPNDTTAMYGGALGAGAAVGALTHGFSFLPGGHMAEQAPGLLKRLGQSVGNQATMMGGMGAAQTVAENAATGHDLERGLPESIATGLVTGAGFGVLGARRRNMLGGATEEPSVAPGSETVQLPTNPLLRGQSVDIAGKEPLYAAPNGDVMTGQQLPAYAQFGQPGKYSQMLQQALAQRSQLEPGADLSATKQVAGKPAEEKVQPPTQDELQQVYAKYGEPQTIPHTREDGSIVAGVDGQPVMVTHFGGSALPDTRGKIRGPYVDPADLQKDIQKLVEEDRTKSNGQRAAEVVAAKAVEDVFGRPARPQEVKLLANAGKLAVATDPEHVRIALQQRLEGLKPTAKNAAERDMISAYIKRLPEQKTLDMPEAPATAPAAPAQPKVEVVKKVGDVQRVKGATPVPDAKALATLADTQGLMMLDRLGGALGDTKTVKIKDNNGKTVELTRDLYMRRLAQMKDKDLSRLQRLTGMDADGNVVNRPMTHEEAAAAEGVKPATISAWAHKNGLSKEVLDKLNAMPREELAPEETAQFESNPAEGKNSGFHVADNVSEIHKAGLYDQSRTEAEQLHDQMVEKGDIAHLAPIEAKAGVVSEAAQRLRQRPTVVKDRSAELAAREKEIEQRRAEEAARLAIKDIDPESLPRAARAFEELARENKDGPTFEQLEPLDQARWAAYFKLNEDLLREGGHNQLEQFYKEMREVLRGHEQRIQEQPADQAGAGAGERSGAGAAPESEGRGAGAEGDGALPGAAGRTAAPEPVVTVKRKRTWVKPAGSEGGESYASHADLEKELLDFMKVKSLGDRVRIVDESTMTDAERAVAAEHPGWQAWATHKNGTLVLRADRIIEGHGRAVFLHEAGSHLGIDNLLPHAARYELVGQIQRWAKYDKGEAGDIARRALKRVEEAVSEDEPSIRQIESVAYFVEEASLGGIKPSALAQVRNFVQRVIDLFSRALSKVLKLDVRTLTPQDIVDLAYGAARRNLGDHPVAYNGEVMKAVYSNSASVGSSMSSAAYGTENFRGTMERNIKRLPPALRKPVRMITAAVHEGTLRAGMAGSFMADLADWAGKHNMPAMKKIADVMERKGAYKTKLDQDLGTVVEQFQKLPDDQQLAVQKFMLDSTTNQKWGYQPSWRDQVEVDPQAEKQWRALPAEARAVADAVFKHEDVMWTRTAKGIMERTLALKQEMIADAERKGAEKAEIEALWADLEKDAGKLPKRLDGPYVPLTRFGSHAVTVKSKELLAAKDEDPQLYRNMLLDQQHYRVEFAEGAGKAELRRDELASQNPNHVVEASRRDQVQYLGRSYEALEKLSQRVKASLEGESEADAKLAGATYRALQEAIIQSLGEYHARASQLHRRNISGVKPEEVMRGVATRGYGANRFLANVVHGKELTDATQLLRQQKDAGGDRATKQLFYNELMNRQADMVSYDTPRWIGHVMRFTTLWKLVTSPAYYLQYISQPVTMFMPLLAGKHSYAEAWGHMGRATREVTAMAKGLFDTDFSALKDANERAMLEDLRAHGTIEVGHEQTFGQLQTMPEKGYAKAWTKAADLGAKVPRSIEMHNRIASALAAYRMERAAGASHEEAVDATRGMIHQAYGDYSAYAAPRIMGKGVLKLATQYRQFQLIHTALLVRLLHNAFGGEDAQVRKAAKLQLAYMAGHYGVLAGGLGIPAAHLVAGAINSVFGDEQDKDAETFVKRHVNNKFVADMILGGVPRAVLGQDLGNRMGAGDILSPMKYVKSDVTTPDGFKDYTLAMMGPFISSMVPQVLRGVNMMADGDFYRGLEQLLPKGMADVLKAARYSEEGVTSPRGQTSIAPEELGVGNLIGQALGSNQAKITSAQHDARVVGDIMDEFKTEANTIKGQFIRARKDGKSTEALIEKWKALNAKMKDMGVRPHTLGELLMAPAKAAQRDRMNVEGVGYRATNRQLVKDIAGEDVSPVSEEE